MNDVDLWSGGGYGYVKVAEDGGFTLYEEFFDDGPWGDVERIDKVDADQVPLLLQHLGYEAGQLDRLLRDAAQSQQRCEAFRHAVRGLSRPDNKFLRP